MIKFQDIFSTISMVIGSLPEKEIIIKKAIVDSDFDGVACAGLLKNIFGDISVLLTEPKLIQQGVFDSVIDSQTVIADLGYVKGCGLYFDHHMHNKPTEDIVGLWENAPSGTGIIFNAYKSKFNLGKYKELVEFVDSFDSGGISKSQVENPDFLLDLAFAITRRDKAFGILIVDAIWKMNSVEDLKNNKIISEKILSFKKQKEEYLQYLKDNVEIVDNIAFVDNRNFTSDIAHAYLVNVVYPNTDVVVMIKRDNGNPNRINLSLSRNNFNDKVVEHNLLPIVTELNPEVSGGHKYACGVALPESISLDEAKKTILRMIKIY